MCQFNLQLPAECPPKIAQPMEGKLFRGIEKLPISNKDFLSHREIGKKCSAKGRYGECDCWGLSVWTSEEAVNHARASTGYAKKWYIASGFVAKTDGVIAATPSLSQPEHHTFFYDVNSDLAAKFSIFLNPIVQ